MMQPLATSLSKFAVGSPFANAERLPNNAGPSQNDLRNRFENTFEQSERSPWRENPRDFIQDYQARNQDKIANAAAEQALVAVDQKKKLETGVRNSLDVITQPAEQLEIYEIKPVRESIENNRSKLSDLTLSQGFKMPKSFDYMSFVSQLRQMTEGGVNTGLRMLSKGLR